MDNTRHNTRSKDRQKSRMESVVQTEELDTGSCLNSKEGQYQVQSFLGQGAFGKVAACLRLSDQKRFAIKVMKGQKQAEDEVSSMKKLSVLDQNTSNIVNWYDFFTDGIHYCLVFEQLHLNLRDFVNQRSPKHLFLKEIRPIVQQLATALHHLKSIKMTHADLKLDNVMLVNHTTEPYRVKLIDFGLATHASRAILCPYLQTRPYRSPEILLGLPFTEAIDMWSLGCLAAELYLGSPLYPGNNEYDMIRYITETQGKPPDSLLKMGRKTFYFFTKFYNSRATFWKLKTRQQFANETGTLLYPPRKRIINSLDGLLNIQNSNKASTADRVAQRKDVFMFVTMLKQMLSIDAATRITPDQLMQHDFVSMNHIVSLYSESSHTRSSFDIMRVCQKNLEPISGKHEQNTCRTNHPSHCPPSSSSSATFSPSPTKPSPSLPAQSPVQCDLKQACFIRSHPCTQTQTTSADKLRKKRRLENEDSSIHTSAHPFERISYALIK